MDYWKQQTEISNSLHYSISRLLNTDYGMDALKTMFPDGEANELNLVLFSTSGVHGTYRTIEEAEDFLKGDDKEGYNEITFLVVHPRVVALKYGNCRPINQADIDFLKKLRASSWDMFSLIGRKENRD